MHYHQRGVTLTELLVVVAMIGILSAIIIPNFLMAVQRSKLNAALADLRTIIRALEIYMIDHDRYPIRSNFIDFADVVNHELGNYYWGTANDPWGKPFRYRTDPGGGHYMIKSFGANKIHNNTTGDFVEPNTWVGHECIGISIEHDPKEVIDKGCDLVFLDGMLAEVAN